MSRVLTDWLDTYMKYVDNTESPISYHRWCALATIAGALQRKVYLRWGLDDIIYPNLYVVLIGPSGRTRKGTAIAIAKNLLKQMPGVTITPESSSGKQAMILAMKRASKNFQDPTDGKIKFHCSVTAFSEELSVFLGQGDIGYLSSLTDWYDSKDDWEYETVGRGKDSLIGLCLNMVGATAPDWIQSMIPREAIGGGFTSRVIFIVEERKRKIVPEYLMSDEDRKIRELLVEDLERISNLAGEITMSPEARKMYAAWYTSESMKADRDRMAVDDPRFIGYNERRPTHLRKIMLCLSASRGDSLSMEVEDFLRAKMFLEEAEKEMAKTFGGLGQSRNSDATELIKNYIQSVGITTRKMILQRFYRDVDAWTLTQVEETLRQMGCIKIKLLIEQQDKSYEWVQ